jgi:hypothetical protein
MATFREAILAASTQPAGATLRVHMENLNAGGGGTSIEVAGIEIEIESGFNIELDTTGTVLVIEDE